jgi:hypothetical protein
MNAHGDRSGEYAVRQANDARTISGDGWGRTRGRDGGRVGSAAWRGGLGRPPEWLVENVGRSGELAGAVHVTVDGAWMQEGKSWSN